MGKIVYIKSGTAKGRLTLGIEHDGECSSYSISESTYLSLGSPPKFYEIPDRDLQDVIFEDERYRAMKKAVNILAASDKSAYVLMGKLLGAGFSKEAAAEAVDEYKRRGYVDEMRQLERLVEREANGSLRGKFYIKRKLISKGYSSADIDRAIQLLTERGEIDFSSNFEVLAEKKMADGDEERRALMYKYGYRM